MAQATQTQWKAQQIGQRILDKIISHLGQHEEPMGSNSGPDVDPKLLYVGVDLSLPADEKQWCAGEDSFDIGHVLDDLGLSSLPHARTASSHEMVNFGIQHGTLQTPHSAVPGDTAVLKGGTGEAAKNGLSYHHTTVLERVDLEAGVAHLVSGNCHDSVARSVEPLSCLTLLRPYVLPA